MAKQTINTGTTANDRSGDTLRSAFTKINANFTELYNTASADVQIPSQTSNNGKYLTTNGTTLSWGTVTAGADLGYFKIQGDYLGTKDNPDTGGWGGHWMYIDPNGEGNAGIAIPSVASQSAGGEFTIYNNHADGGAIRFLTNTGTWYFNQDGSLNVPGKITGTNVLSVWTSNIDSIDLGVDTEVNLQDWVFTGPVTGQVAIQDVVGTTEINGNWYFQATNPWSFRLYSDSLAQTPVDSTTWTAYVSGGTASEINSNGVAIGAGNKQWTFGDNGYLRAPGNIVVGRALDGDESHFVIDAVDYWTSIQWKNMSSLQDPGATPFECQAQLLRVFANDNTVTEWCNVQNPREELVAVTAVKPSGTDYNGLMISTSEIKIPDSPYNDGVGTRYDWIFGGNGSLVVPTLNGNARTGWGNNFQFEKSNNQKIISTQNGTSGNQTVERLVISGGDSYYDGSTYHGEGGDIYLWAGRGENGGDIKVDAGNALSGQEGGTIKIRGGNSDSGTGGFVEIWSGSGTYGAPITLSAWNGGGWNQWIFEPHGNLTLPSGGDIKNYDGYSVIKSIPQNLQSSLNDYTLTLADGGKHIYRTEGDGYGVTIPTNASVAFPIGTAITVVSGNSECYFYLEDGDVTTLWGAGFNAYNQSWYIPSNSMATLLKLEEDKWMLSGAGLASNL